MTTLTFDVQVVFGHDEETSALLRRSTREAAVGDWDAAIATLYAARERLVNSPLTYPTETWCKLPLYLSRAGRFDEADAALDWLLADLPRRKKKEWGAAEPNAGAERKAELKRTRAHITRAAKDAIEYARGVVARRREAALRRAARSA